MRSYLNIYVLLSALAKLDEITFAFCVSVKIDDSAKMMSFH